MKKIVISTAMLLAVASSFAQTNATDWTATDCIGNSHNLFTELDAGKVIVLAWVMPCITCVAPTTTAYNIRQDFAASNPNVLFYVVDDGGNTDCLTLAGWVSSEGVGSTKKMTIFSNAGNVIKQNDFGGPGMPHVVVLGGWDHKIFFNGKGPSAGDSLGLVTAINQALVATSVASLNNKISFSVVPNPVADHLAISYTQAIKKVTVTALNGQMVKEEVYPNGKMNPVMSMSQMANGLYMVKVTDIDNKTGAQQIVKQ